jgi:hypothetical protein
MVKKTPLLFIALISSVSFQLFAQKNNNYELFAKSADSYCLTFSFNTRVIV